jgi:hypothetical protein
VSNTIALKEHERRSAFALGAGLLVLSLGTATSACNSTNTAGTPTAVTEKSMRSMAEKAALSVGRQGRVSTVYTKPWLVVFEETHTSRIGQAEIALMLFRLHRDQRLRHIALEGHAGTKGLDATWYHRLPFSQARRRAVATTMLKEGEVSAAEYMALLFPDVTVHPIEQAESYAVELPDSAGGAGIAYLFRIALKGLERNPSKLARHAADIERLQAEGKHKELRDLVLSIDPWVEEKSRIFRQQSTKPAQAEDWLGAIDAIEARARELGVNPEPSEQDGLRKMREFFVVAQKRSRQMAQATAAIAKESPDAPVAMHIGAAHTTGVCKSLDAVRQAYVVISPLSLTGKEEAAGTMSFPAFQRKGNRQSVDAVGPGRWLDGRRKPPPVVEEPWLEAKASLYLAAAEIAARAGGGPPPRREPPFGLSADDLRFPSLHVPLVSIRRAEDEVVFQAVVFPGEERRRRTVWVRAKHVSAPEGQDADADLERLLNSTIDALRREVAAEDGAADPTVTPVIQVASDTIARISLAERGVQKALTQI